MASDLDIILSSFLFCAIYLCPRLVTGMLNTAKICPELQRSEQMVGKKDSIKDSIVSRAFGINQSNALNKYK